MIRTRCRDRSRAAGKRAHGIAAKLRLRTAAGREETRAAVVRITGELAALADRAAADAGRLLTNARRALRRAATPRRRRPGPAAGATHQIAAQARQRVAGITPDGASRRVSLHDPDARPIAKGRLGKPVEFGHKAQVLDNEDGGRARPHRRAG